MDRAPCAPSRCFRPRTCCSTVMSVQGDQRGATLPFTRWFVRVEGGQEERWQCWQKNQDGVGSNREWQSVIGPIVVNWVGGRSWQ
jgi:hypothetical protein